MDAIVEISNRLMDGVDLGFKRSLIERIDWSQRLIEIRGSRGVGKTTLLLQKSKELKDAGKHVIYASLDLPFFFTNSLFDFIDEFTKFGGTHIFLDEVHRYPSKNKNSDWSLEIKNIFDAFPKLQIVYSGSSILHLYEGKGDLSRRKASYLMNGLSFREYLEFQHQIQFPVLTLEEILTGHEKIALEFIEQFKPLAYYKSYLKTGFFPFFKKNEEVYFRQLRNMVNLIIDVDLPYLAPISIKAKEQLKRLLGAISTTVPYVPNMKNLAELIGVTDHRTLLKYLYLLEQAQLIALLHANAIGNKQLEKPDKIFLNNTNYKHAFSFGETNIGNERETFFFNQVSFMANVSYPKKGDFVVNKNYLFEIGGKNKTYQQIGMSAHSYIASDFIETGFGNKIPLWLFGFLY